jgi:hypothetical protein
MDCICMYEVCTYIQVFYVSYVSYDHAMVCYLLFALQMISSSAAVREQPRLNSFLLQMKLVSSLIKSSRRTDLVSVRRKLNLSRPCASPDRHHRTPYVRPFPFPFTTLGSVQQPRDATNMRNLPAFHLLFTPHIDAALACALTRHVSVLLTSTDATVPFRFNESSNLHVDTHAIHLPRPSLLSGLMRLADKPRWRCKLLP